MKKIFGSLLVLYMCTNLHGVNNDLILSDTFPNKLSEFNFFIDNSAQVPHDTVVPYELISTLFSASLTMSMSFVEAEVDYAEND